MKHPLSLFRGWHWLLALWMLVWMSHATAQNLQPVPELKARVMDFTGSLSTQEASALKSKLATLERERGAQLVVLIIPSTGPEAIEQYANRVASTWKIGRQAVGDGLLLVVAKNDRTLRIEVARALEGQVTDLQASRIIQNDIAPQMRQGQFAKGIEQGVDSLIALLQLPEPMPAPAAPTTHAGWSGSILNLLQWLLGGWLGTLAVMSIKRKRLRLQTVLTSFKATFVCWIVGGCLGGLVGWLSLGFTPETLYSVYAGYLGFLGVYLANLVSTSTGKAPAHAETTTGYSSAESFSSADNASSPDTSPSFSPDQVASGGGGSFAGGGASGKW